MDENKALNKQYQKEQGEKYLVYYYTDKENIF